MKHTEKYKYENIKTGEIVRIGEWPMLDSVNKVVVSIDVEVLLEVDDVMNILKCSRTALWRYMHCEGLPYLKMGGKQSRVRFRPESLREWLKKREIIEPVHSLN